MGTGLRLCAVAGVVLSLGAAGQTRPEAGKLSEEELREDFRVLRSALEEGHAGLYSYTPEHEMDRVFSGVMRGIDAPMTSLQFLRHVFPVIIAIGDGHTQLLPSRQTFEEANAHATHLPLQLRVLGGGVYVEHDYSDPPAAPIGAQVLDINGLPVATVLARVQALMSSDAGIETFKTRWMEYPPFFGYLYTWAFGITTVYDLRVRDREGTETTITLPGLKAGSLASRRGDRYPETVKPVLEFAYHEEVPILTIRSFGAGPQRQAGVDYEGTFERWFEAVAQEGSRALILDLRGNSGGNQEHPKMLLGHLLSEPFTYYSRVEAKKDRFEFFRHVEDVPSTLQNETLRRNRHGWYDQVSHANYGPQAPRQPGFTGAVYVLMDGRSYSAAGELLSLLHQYERATFVGEESGTGYYTSTAGYIPRATLPNTGIRVAIPLIRFRTEIARLSERGDHGVLPDHAVEPTMDDVMAGRDPVMGLALQLAQQH